MILMINDRIENKTKDFPSVVGDILVVSLIE